jgi:hypothetical protein
MINFNKVQCSWTAYIACTELKIDHDEKDFHINY